VPAELHDRALLEIDKLDKIGVEGVAAQLVSIGVEAPGIAEQLAQLGDVTWDSATASPPPSWLDQGAFGDLLALRAALPGGSRHRLLYACIELYGTVVTSTTASVALHARA